MTINQTNPEIPLTNQDQEALDAIFEKVELQDIDHIEVTAARYTAAPLEPWEEKGWIINSSLPTYSF